MNHLSTTMIIFASLQNFLWRLSNQCPKREIKILWENILIFGRVHSGQELMGRKRGFLKPGSLSLSLTLYLSLSLFKRIDWMRYHVEMSSYMWLKMLHISNSFKIPYFQLSLSLSLFKRIDLMRYYEEMSCYMWLKM